jgi:hypothetical protein
LENSGLRPRCTIPEDYVIDSSCKSLIEYRDKDPAYPLSQSPDGNPKKLRLRDHLDWGVLYELFPLSWDVAIPRLACDILIGHAWSPGVYLPLGDPIQVFFVVFPRYGNPETSSIRDWSGLSQKCLWITVSSWASTEEEVFLGLCRPDQPTISKWAGLSKIIFQQTSW